MANLTSNLVVSLIDHVTAPAKQAAGALKGISDQAKQSGDMKKIHDEAASAVQRHSEALSRAKVEAFAAAAAMAAFYYSVQNFVKGAAEMETSIFRIGEQSRLTVEQLKTMKETAEEASAASTIPGVAIANSMRSFMTKTKAGFEDTRTAMEPIGRASAAFGADIKATTDTAAVGVNTLRIAVGDLSTMFSHMAESAKGEGAVPFSELMQAFPRLANMARQLGLTGERGVDQMTAALQALRISMGSTEEAAAGLDALFGQILTTKSIKRFRSAGIDIEGFFKYVKAKDLDPIEEFALLMKDRERKDPNIWNKVVISPEQRRAGQGLERNLPEYRRSRADSAKATGSEVNEHYAAWLKTIDGSIADLTNHYKLLRDAIGEALEPSYIKLNQEMTKWLEMSRKFVKDNPELVTFVTKVAGAFVLLSAGIAAAHLAATLIGISLGPLTGILLGVAAATKFVDDNMEGMKAFGTEFKKAFTDQMDDKTLKQFNTDMAELKGLVTGSWALDTETWKAWGRAVGESMGQDFTMFIHNLNTAATAIRKLRQEIAEGWAYDKEHMSLPDINIDQKKRDAYIRGQMQNDFGPVGMIPNVPPLTEFKRGMYGLQYDIVETARQSLTQMFDALNVKMFAWREQLIANVQVMQQRIADGAASVGPWLEAKYAEYKTSALTYMDQLKAKYDETILAIKSTDWIQVGMDWGKAVYDSFTSKLDELVAWCKNLPGRILAAMGDFPKAVSDWFKGGVDAARPPGGKAGGAPMVFGAAGVAAEATASISTTAVDTAKLAVDKLGASLLDLNSTVTPQVNLTPLQQLRVLADEIDATLSSIGTRAAGIGRSALDSLSGNGDVQRRLRLENNDFSVQ